MGEEGTGMELVILKSMGEHCSNSHIRGDHFNNELAGRLRKSEDRSRCESSLKIFKSLLESRIQAILVAGDVNVVR